MARGEDVAHENGGFDAPDDPCRHHSSEHDMELCVAVEVTHENLGATKKEMQTNEISDSESEHVCGRNEGGV
jgi:hypothetical protein